MRIRKFVKHIILASTVFLNTKGYTATYEVEEIEAKANHIISAGAAINNSGQVLGIVKNSYFQT